MSDRLFGWMTINQMLFVSHLVLVLSIIFGMSYSRYQNDWSTKVEYLADMSASHLAAYNTFFSGSVAGRNYANLLMQSTLDNLKAIPNLKFAEVSGTSDYLKQTVKVRYSIAKSKGWRLDVTAEEAQMLANKLVKLESKLAATPTTNSVHTKKLNRLINKLKVDLSVINENLKLRSLPIPTIHENLYDSGYYLDEQAGLLYIQVKLRNNNGGYFRAVVDATSLEQIQKELLVRVLYEALVALVISFLLIYLVTFWLVSPVKALALSMKQDIEKIDQSKIPEIKRADEIGDLARSYSSLITKIKNQLRILHNQTETDPLTGIGSRFKYQKHAAKTVQQALHHGEAVYFIMCDIDNFKLFNDSYGHTEGDNALTDVANAMHSLLEPKELGCRLGGEEFVFILSSKVEEKLKERVDELRVAVQNLNIEHCKNSPHDVVTVSIGAVPISTALHEVTVEQSDQCIQRAIVKADEQLYMGKEAGRNVVMYSQALIIE
ncbi:diguanylate cyclase [Vibrio europaeus]|uniref:diguanylate cyclase domain-containing protein n=1 Tax=Vibrio europaeus TaxID=300876 RepID=UPI002340561A|nr:diguanylate cyclase [Vibrio europaeus]MDC5838682.1 diguanylate cyclase [Vibrio europaeus]